MPSASEPEDGTALPGACEVRRRSFLIFEAASRGETSHFRLRLERLEAAVRRVLAVTRRRYPDLEIPLHSRWRHFGAGGVDRARLVARGAERDEAARSRIELALLSVLCDAGAGPSWRYREDESGAVFARSEGLAVASLRAMEKGLFSADPRNPWRADAAALRALDADRLASAFQHRSENPLAGFEGRLRLLRRLGETADPVFFGTPPGSPRSITSRGTPRLGNLYDHWLPRREGLSASEILDTLLSALSPIWPRIAGLPPGDFGRHPAVPGDGLLPFHKILQWLAYSLVEPLEAAGFRIVGLDALTGLAEYRNGGLFIDCGVIEPYDLGLLDRPLEITSEPVVEWRALTVALLDRLAEGVRARLGKTARELPLAKVLEGGSWAAGREIAVERRREGRPPLMILPDGITF